MSWMNGCEIDYCRPETPELRHGAAFLRGFKDLIDAISDGWAYWSYGTKCSADLQTLVQTPPCGQRAVTLKQVHVAERRVLTFLGRCKQTKDNPTVQAFITDWERSLKETT